MRGQDQTDVRRRRLASAWLLLVAVSVALAARGVAQGQDTPVATWKGDEREAIRLKADRVQTWTEEGSNWFLLEDQAEITQGDVSIRADRAVARVERAGRVGGTIFRIDLYVEGQVRDPGDPGRIFRAVQTQLVTTSKVGIENRVPGGRHVLQRPPAGLPILARAFAGKPSPPAPEITKSPPSTKSASKETVVETSASGPAPVSSRPAPANPPGEMPGSAVAPFGSGVAPATVAGPEPAKVDPEVRRTQVVAPAQPAFPDDFSAEPVPDPASPTELPPLAPNSVPLGPSDTAPVSEPPTTLNPLPDAAPRGVDDDPRKPLAPVLVGSQRITTLYPRGLGEIQLESLPVQPDGTQIIIVRNGVQIVTQSKEQGIVDIEADNVVIWRRSEGRKGPPKIDYNNQMVDNTSDPLEFYLEGHVIFRQDQQIYQGKSDQRTYQGERVYYDVRKDQLLALNATVELFSPGLVTPSKIRSPRILQYHPQAAGDNGQLFASTLAAIQADKTVSTGSRFAKPGYRFTSNSIDIVQVVDDRELAKNDGVPFDGDDLTWMIDARRNIFFMGPIPVFFWPRLYVEADNLNPPLSGVSFATNNYFGQQFRTDYDMFNLLQKRHPPQIDVWNLDVDYLSARDKKPGQGIAVGSEIGWYGSDLIKDIQDPYRKTKKKSKDEEDEEPSPLTNYAGYFDTYGLFDGSRDVLGGGPAVITNSPNNNAAGRAGFTRISNPFFTEAEGTFRGMAIARHMQSFVNKDTPLDEDLRLNLEFEILSDRNFLEQYFKRRFDVGLDQENLAYLIRQRQNTAATLTTSVNLQSWFTQTQWLPKGDYYRLGDSLLGNHLTYYQHTGVDYANVHTAAEVNNKTIFSYLPIDPISNTKGTFESGRLYTAHELDLPLNFNFVRFTPYVQGQAVGWNNQIAGHAVGRIMGAAGARADLEIWKRYPNAESELLNIHGLNHKIDFVADARDAFSNINLNSLGVQDELDDNSYEYSRRYFALTNYIGGVLPQQYDPRLLMLRRALSPITGTTDIQGTMDTVKLGIHQRLQTKRGQEGKRHIMDYMVFDLDTTYFPQASRDNFGKPFGQNTYNYEWYIGDRTSIVSYGWFEFWKVGGDPYLAYNTSLDRNDPFGLRIITSGLSITRIPKGNVFIGYTIVNTGPISTSALNTQYSYWLSPKWFGTVAESYDFGNGLLLAATGALTRIGADYLTSVGLAVSPLQHSYQFQFSISPRLSPNIQFGSAGGVTRLDSRFAPVE